MILDFEKVPVRCHTKDTLSFWLLSCRQIQAPTTMPDGCIICAYSGAFLVLLLILQNFDAQIDEDSDNSSIEESDSSSIQYSFEEIKKLLPTHYEAYACIACFSFERSNKRKKQNKFNRTSRKKEFAKELASRTLPETLQTIATDILVTSEISIVDQARSQGITLPEQNEELLEYALEGILDATDTPATPFIQNAYEWLYNLRENRTRTGQKMQRVEAIDKALEDEAQYRECKMYKADF